VSSINVEAVVLASEHRSERDRRLTLFTLELGRLWVQASGVLRPGAKLAAGTEPGVRGRFRLWLPEGSSTGRVTGGGVVEGHAGVRREWRRLTSALFFCEWTDRLTPLLQPHEEKFFLLTKALAALERWDPAPVRAAFLVQFARLAGYGPIPGVESGSLDAWTFDGPPDFFNGDSPAVEAQVIQSLSPHLSRPLKSLEQGRRMDHFLRRTEIPQPLGHF